MNDRILLQLGLSTLLIFTPLLLNGCGGGQQVRLSTTHQQAINHNQRGLRAEAKGDSERAKEEFASALRLQSSIDNAEGKAVALVNSSRVCRLHGEVKEARGFIDQAIAITPTTSPIFHEVAFEKALVSVREGNVPEAKKWALLVGNEDSSSAAGSLNLLARMSLQEKSVSEAAKEAEKALGIARKIENKEEEANALRLLGEIALLQRQGEKGVKAYEEALVIDKSLGKSRKIAADLRGLAQAAIESRDYTTGASYYRRAFDVNDAAGDNKAATGDLLELIKLLEIAGDQRQAAAVKAEREEYLKKELKGR